MITSFVPVASSSAGCCYLVTASDGATILLDAGVPLDTIKKATGFNVAGLSACLVSHGHGDHIMSAEKITAYQVDVWGSYEAVGKNVLSNRCFKVARPGETFETGPFTVTPFQAVHDAPGTLGFVVDHESDRLLYLTDSAYSPWTFEGITHFCVECNHSREIIRAKRGVSTFDARRHARTETTHMSLERLLDMLKANDLSKVREIWLLHLSDQNADEEGFITAVRRETGKPTFVAQKRAEVAR